MESLPNGQNGNNLIIEAADESIERPVILEPVGNEYFNPLALRLFVHTISVALILHPLHPRKKKDSCVAHSSKRVSWSKLGTSDFKCFLFSA